MSLTHPVFYYWLFCRRRTVQAYLSAQTCCVLQAVNGKSSSGRTSSCIKPSRRGIICGLLFLALLRAEIIPKLISNRLAIRCEIFLGVLMHWARSVCVSLLGVPVERGVPGAEEGVAGWIEGK